jgi:hypothetical protein
VTLGVGLAIPLLYWQQVLGPDSWVAYILAALSFVGVLTLHRALERFNGLDERLERIEHDRRAHAMNESWLARMDAAAPPHRRSRQSGE